MPPRKVRKINSDAVFNPGKRDDSSPATAPISTIRSPGRQTSPDDAILWEGLRRLDQTQNIAIQDIKLLFDRLNEHEERIFMLHGMIGMLIRALVIRKSVTHEQLAALWKEYVEKPYQLSVRQAFEDNAFSNGETLEDFGELLNPFLPDED